MNGIRISLALATGVLLAGSFFCRAEEASGDGPAAGTEKPAKAGKEGRPGKGGEGKELMGQMRKIMESTRTDRRAFGKEQADKAREVYKTLAGKDGDTVSAALTTLYTELCANAKAYAEKEKTAVSAAVNALEIPEDAKTRAIARYTERAEGELKNLEERQQDRLAFAKSLAGLSADEVQTAVTKRRDEIHEKMEKRRDEMKKKMEERAGKPEGAGGEGKPEGGPGAGAAGDKGTAGPEGAGSGDKPGTRPEGRPVPRAGDELLGMEYLGAMGPDGRKGERGEKGGKADKNPGKKPDSDMQDE